MILSVIASHTAIRFVQATSVVRDWAPAQCVTPRRQSGFFISENAVTTKEIAEAVSKDITTVQRWVKRVSGKMQSINSKMQSSTSTHPANYTEEETLAIIREGMGEVPAGVYKAATGGNQPSKLTATELQQLRLSVRDGLLSIPEARRMMGFAPAQNNGNLPDHIARQVYAVASKAYKNHQKKIEDDRMNNDLFDERH